MFEDELTVIQESRARLTTIRERVRARGECADEEALTRVLTAAEQVRRAADALELAVISQVARFDEERGADGIYRPVLLPVGCVADMAPDSVALAVGAGPVESYNRCHLAARTVSDLSALADLAAQGLVRERSLSVVASETKDASSQAVQAVVDHLLGPMRGRPDSIRMVELDDRETRKACRRIIQRVEPEVLNERADRNRRERLDVRIGPGPVGTSDLTATLPTEVAMVIKAAVDEAGARRLEQDPLMTTGAARAWGLADLALRGTEVTAHVRLGIPVITSAASRLAFAPSPGGERSEGTTLAQELHGPTAREGRLVTGDGPDMVDVIPEEWCGGDIRSQTEATLGPHGPTTWISGCDIPGVGYIPPDAVAAIVTNLEPKVGRALIDARTGTLVETSNPRYVITDSVRDFVAARDGLCRMWGCNRRVRAEALEHVNDIDHATPWPLGESSPSNLSGLCRHHHRVKHSPRWSHTLLPDGTTEWRSPGGVPAMTFPDHAVHVDEDEGREVHALLSPPQEGARQIELGLAEPIPF